jgi:polysaccharide biosynthesis/export protein
MLEERMNRKTWTPCLVGLSLLCAAGAAAKPKKEAPPAVPVTVEVPKPVLTAGDRLQVKVVNEPDYSKEYVVEENGKIKLDMIGEVQAAGMTTAEFSTSLEKHLARYIRRPQLTVLALQRIGVAGGVHTPGAYDFPKEQPVRLMDALLRAGGLVREAKKNRVLLVKRANSPGQRNAQLVDIGSFLRKGSMENNPLLGPNDLVYVDVEDPERQPKGAAALLQRALPLIGAFF